MREWVLKVKFFMDLLGLLLENHHKIEVKNIINSFWTKERFHFLNFWHFMSKVQSEFKNKKKNLILPLGNLALGCQSNNELICWINYILKMHTAAKRANCRFCKMYHIVHKILKIDYLQGVVKTFYSFIF